MRYAVLLLCLLLPLCAQAEGKLTLKQLKEETPAYLDMSVTNKKGRKVEFSAPILMPDADAFPVLRVVRNYSTEEALEPYKEWIWNDELSSDLSLNVNPYSEQAEEYRGDSDVTAIYHNLWEENPEISADDIYAAEGTMSLAQAADEMDALIRELLGEEYGLIVDQARTVGPLYTFTKKGRTVIPGELFDCGEMTGKGGYWVDGILTVDGIPFFGGPFFRQGFGLRYREHLLRNALDAVDFWHYRSEDYYLVWMQAFRPVEVIYEDVPLCSFETVREAIEDLVERDKLQKVHAIYLGYIVWLDPDVDYPNSRKDADRYEGLRMPYIATPVWVVEGCYASSTGRDYSEYPESEGDELYNYRSDWGHSYIMINAQTGKASDPYDESTKRMYAPEILTW